MLTAERLRELLDYDPETGVFTRRVRRTSGGTGWPDKVGYLYLMVDGKTYAAHRLAWLFMTGEWPTGELDHLDGNKACNAFANLREATRQTNMQNEVRARKSNKSGLMGVHFRKDRGKWVSAIRINGRARRLGQFDSPEEAHAAYVEAKRIHHAGFTL